MTSRPLVPVDTKGLDDVADALLRNVQPNPDTNTQDTQSPANIPNPDKYIILPGASYSNYAYPTMLVAMDRTHQGKDWFDCHKLLAKKGDSMLTLRQYADFLRLLKSGNVLDGRAQRLSKSKVEAILDDIIAVRNPARAEWLDADFKVKNNVLHINHSHNVDNKGNVVPQYSEALLSCIMENKAPGIDLEDWISKANSQGLPPVSVKKGSLYYYFPLNDNNSVAGFGANSVRAFLGCGRDPSGTDSNLGVRAARKKI